MFLTGVPQTPLQTKEQSARTIVAGALDPALEGRILRCLGEIDA